MTLSPTLFHGSSYTSIFASHHHPHSKHNILLHANPHPQHHQFIFDRHHVSDVVINFLMHMFAPAACMACTSSPPRWTQETIGEDQRKKEMRMSVEDDDERAIVESEDEDEDEDKDAQDGGPLCREATIELWKTRSGGKRRTSTE